MLCIMLSNVTPTLLLIAWLHFMQMNILIYIIIQIIMYISMFICINCSRVLKN